MTAKKTQRSGKGKRPSRGNAESTGILILGMHRSGTSALAGALARLGVPLGRRLVDAGPDNPTGYFENAQAVTLDERLLHALGRGWDDLRELPTDWLASPAAMHARSALDALLDEEFVDARVWAVKDPRLCRLLPLWRDVLERRGIDPFCLFVVRDPAQVSASLHRRDGMDDQYAALLWCQHLLVAERDSRGLRRTMIDYAQLLSEPLPALDAIAAAIGIDWPVQTRNAEAELADFLRPDQQHHREAVTLTKGPASDLAARLFVHCCDILEHGGDWDALVDAMPQLHKLVQRTVPALSQWLQVLSKARSRLDACDERLGAVDRSLREVHDLSLSRLARIQAQGHQLDEVHGALDEVTQLAVQRLAIIEAQGHQLDDVHGAQDEVTQLAVQRLAIIEAQGHQLDEVHGALDEVTQLAVQRLAIIEAQGHQLDEVHGALEAVKSLALERLATIESQSRSLAELRIALDETTRQSLERQAAVQTLTNEVAARDREIESGRSVLAQTRAELSALREALQQVHASRSWRLTRPLRAVSAWLRRLAGG